MSGTPPLVVVDAANVVGSVPDGWWRDRAAAAERLREALAPLARTGLTRPGVPAFATSGPLELVLVVEGAARGVEATPEVGVIAAEHSGDDAIVELVRSEVERRAVLVVTADRGLKARVLPLGAEVVGPRAVYP